MLLILKPSFTAVAFLINKSEEESNVSSTFSPRSANVMNI